MIRLEIENTIENIRMTIIFPKSSAEIKKELKRVDEGKNAKYGVVKVFWNDIDINTSDYFHDLSTMNDIIKGIEEIEKDMNNLENIEHEDLCDFLLSNVSEYDYRNLVEENIDYLNYILGEYCVEDLWEYIDWETRLDLAEPFIDYEELVRTTNKSELIQCLIDKTSYSLKDLIEQIQNGGARDGAE